MTAQFPTALVTTTNIPNANPATSLSANNHSGKHDDLRDEIIALETKVGVNGSAVTTTHDYKLSGVTGSDKAVGAAQTVTVTNKTLGSGTKINTGTVAAGDMNYSSDSSGTQTRVAIGSSGQVLTSNGTTPYWTSPSASNTNYAVSTGSANAYVVTLTPALGAYTSGVLVQFNANFANTGACTVNVNGLGAKTIKKLNGATDLVSGDIATGMIVELEYDGTNFVMLNPVANAGAASVDIQAFTTAGTTTWTKPALAKWVDVYVIGGGGAGGAGGAGSTNGGGAGGGWGMKRFMASALGATENLTVGAGGTPVVNSSGNAGGATTFGTTVLLRATGGAGGTNAVSTGGTANGDVFFSGGNGGQSAVIGPVDTATNPSPRGGGAAGYNGGAPATPTAGQAGGAFITNYVRAGAAGGTSAPTSGSSAAAATVGLLFGGVGGGGAGYNGAGVGGNGGNGNLGSGGGGAIVAGNTAGTGGDGAVVVVTYF